ncbi:hypothetical protein evm_008309 [Chilo suppressalis]|nr:hypothetical protein evm_008309 [Chilo suppressalis]
MDMVPTGSSSLNSTSSAKPGISISCPNDSCKNIRLDSSSSSDDEDEASSASSAEPDRRGEDRRTETSRTTGAIGTTGASGNTGPTGNVGALGMRGTIGMGSGSGSGTLVPSHAKSLSAPAPPPPLHPVTKSNSNPAVDKHMAIATGTLSSPASRQSSEDAGASAASAGAGASAAAAAAGGSMWLGTEDGAIHVYSCLDSIRLKKNKLKMQHSAPVHAIVYVEGKVFVALGNGDVVVYCRDIDGAWAERCTLGVGGGAAVGGLLLAAGRVWCAAHTALHVLNPRTMQIEETFQISTESKPISHIAVSGGAVWVALHNAAQLRAYRASSRDLLADINLTPLVTRMLHGCDDIIRQHKAACLRVTALAAHSGTLWVGTSAGVLLTAPLHHAPHPRTGAFTTPALTGIPYGHTGHVRFLTIVENPAPARPQPKTSQSSLRAKAMSRRSALADKRDPPPTKETLVISGGDGYEDFRSSGSNEDAGREDSTNHLLLWRV